MAQRSRSVLLMACLAAATLQPLLMARRAVFCVPRRNSGFDTAKRALPILGVTGRMAVPSGDGAIATTEAQRAEVLRLPPKTVTGKDAEIAAPQGPQPRQGSWAFKPRQSYNAETADDDNDDRDDESDLEAARRAALRLPGPKEQAELAAKQKRQEEIEELYAVNGSTDGFTVPEKITYMAFSASVMWLWIMNAYKTWERFGGGPHL
mmetsp:Transcript_20912/g.40890  ORF Transcript_20912/g.40890 Transcript_20912/m.40890 type:complete len:207 (-) Transcript_20912:415-1035(-)